MQRPRADGRAPLPRAPARKGRPCGRVQWAHGFTLVDLLTTLAALVILLGLMVHLARYVRHRSAEALTHELLVKLERMLTQYADLRLRAVNVPPLVSSVAHEYKEADLQSAALANNRALVRICRSSSAVAAVSGLPLALFDQETLRDAWGTPVVYVPPRALNVGIAPKDRAFFLSAGPDRMYSTVIDNLYSYERPWDTVAGHRE